MELKTLALLYQKSVNQPSVGVKCKKDNQFLGQKWYCFCFRNHRLHFGKIDLREKRKELELRKQIQYVNIRT